MYEGRKNTFFWRREVHQVSKMGQVAILFSRKTKHIKSLKAIVTNVLHLSWTQISELYCIRWEIEVFIKQLKGLRLGDYRVARAPAYLRHVRLVTLAYQFVLHYGIQQGYKGRSFHQAVQHCRQRLEADRVRYLLERAGSKRGQAWLQAITRQPLRPSSRYAAANSLQTLSRKEAA